MPIATIKIALLWSLAVNYGMLLLWLLVIALARDAFYRINERIFPVSSQTFDAVNYGGIAAYKGCIIFFNLVPWIALSMAT
jgi:hypothetical protein